MQPTFLPWMGWFDIADQADQLVVLDDVAFSKQSWQQRNRVRTPKGLEYLTVPVRTSGLLGQPIREVQIADPRLASRVEKTVRANYARAPHFDPLMGRFCDALQGAAQSGRLADLNLGLIRWACTELGVSTPQTLSSEIPVSGSRGEYVAALCAHFGAVDYLSPFGAREYLLEDRDHFDRRSISVWLHAYDHPTYRQVFDPFIPFASVIDLLFNAGPDAMRILRSGRGTAAKLDAQSLRHAGDTHAE